MMAGSEQMPFYKRTLSSTIKQVSATFPVLLLTGPRQVGKTTLLESCVDGERRYVTLDDFDERELAESDPALFLQMHKPPVIIDEVQLAPKLFSAIKMMVDQLKKPGLFWLTGSQKFHLMQGINESLAGRVAILDLLGLSQAEIKGSEVQEPFLPTLDWLETAQKEKNALPSDLLAVYQRIWRGSFPKLLIDGDVSRDIFYKSYIQTYIQRDVRMLAHVGDEMAFQRLLRAAAARTGQLINYADLSRDVDVDQKTIKAWLSILESSGLIYYLQPYHSNLTKRLVKTPKLYFLDTGLCAYLTQWSTAESLEAGAMSGSILETFMVAEILKSYWHNGKQANFYFYRDKDKKEIDLLIEQDNTLYPVEFKKTASPALTASKNFSVLEKLGPNLGSGAVICLKEKPVALSKTVIAIPLGWL